MFQFSMGLTGKINDRFLTNQSARSISVINIHIHYIFIAFDIVRYTNYRKRHYSNETKLFTANSSIVLRFQ